MEHVLSFVVFVAGLLIGSFLNVVALRLPAGESVITPRSHCPSCSASLRPYDLIPLVSFLMLLGRCRYCRQTISPVYPLVEAGTACLFVLAYWRFGMTAELFVAWPLFSLLVIVTHIDMRLKLIPNAITYPGMVYFGCVRLFYHTEPWWHYAAGFFIAGGLLLLIAVLSRGGIGGGDIKLMAMTGLAIGWKWALFAFTLASLIGGAVGVMLLVLKKAGRKDAIAFGPFLAIGIVLAYVWGPSIWTWYVNL